MSLNVARARAALQSFDFKTLFIEELGWDRHSASLPVSADGRTFAFQAVAEKKGLQVFECRIPPAGDFPEYNLRRKVERQVAKSAHEHLLIFTDAARTRQVWQWVKKEMNRPLACREFTFHKGHTGEDLIQRLHHLEFQIEEEETLSLVDVAGRTRQAFDVDRVTKRFYERFKAEHAAFLKFIEGITAEGDREWYASLMLNRLMFVYFIQKKGFLNSDPNYLRNKLNEVRQRKGRDKFLTFYRYFLLRLFHEGLGQPEGRRMADLEALLGKVPYLNGGLFDLHELEHDNPAIHIPDEAFERLFAFFDGYKWHLDERPLRDDREINPDVLGYIFEKYINQKQMGAYYTKEDITGYIARNTIIPFLFDAAASAQTSEVFKTSEVWAGLRDDPDRYIHEPVRRGVIDGQGKAIPESSLPEFVRRGMNDPKERMFDKRYNLAEADLRDAEGKRLTLPTETWREYAARRQRCLELREKLSAGQVYSINDLITYNLDICQFAEDVIENCEGPELLRAFYHAIETMSVLDPTCGSGAFLFAALNVLEPLYEACLGRMQAFLDDLAHAGGRRHPETFADFRKTLAEVEKHPNRRYFILKSIVINNLYGVDIMEEAVEICKLRLFLKLVAQVDAVRQLEPLPDVDFNIRPGNTLVGFATLQQVRETLKDTLGFNKEVVEQIIADANRTDELFKGFRRLQVQYGAENVDFSGAKAELRRQLDTLREYLDRYLAKEYGVDPDDAGKYAAWQASHQPFHWFAEFYGIMSRGGFDVIIGNPPYLEIREVNYTPAQFRCTGTGAIHAMCIERSLLILSCDGTTSMIVPLALVSTQRMQVVQQLLEEGRSTYYINFSWRPGKLFDTVNRALTIFVAAPSTPSKTFTTCYLKWRTESRDYLMYGVRLVEVPCPRPAFWVPKLEARVERTMLAKCLGTGHQVQDFLANSQHRIYYRTDGGLYWKVFTDFAPAFVVNGKAGHSTRETWISVAQVKLIQSLIAVLSSNLFWWWYTVTSNCRHLNPYDIHHFPIPARALEDTNLQLLGKTYLAHINKNSMMLVRNQKQTGRTETQSFKIQLSKDIIDEIDCVLAKHYGFTDEELDFIVNYDIKYRMGQGADGDGDD